MKFQETIGEVRLDDVLEMTEEFFGSRPTIEEEFDPENPDYRYLVVSVVWKGAPKESVDKRLEWHERVEKLGHVEVGRLRLSILPF